MQKSMIKEITQEECSLGQQLHDLRISKRLAKYYNKKVQINLVNRD